jgi:hypothetical protein
MSRVKIIGAAFGALFMLSAVASTTASAESWFVNGTQLSSGSSAALSTTFAVDKPLVFNTPGLPLKFSCGGSIGAVTPKITGEQAFEAASIAFRECSVIEPTTCKLAAPELKTEASTGEVHKVLRLFGHEVFLWFSSNKTPKIAELELEGTSCSISGRKAIKGQFTTEGPTLENEEAVQAVLALGSIENNSLQLANDTTYIENGEFLLKLESGSKWSFH